MLQILKKYCLCIFIQAVQFLHKLVLQVSVDVFFIDWERPRSKANRTVQGTRIFTPSLYFAVLIRSNYPSVLLHSLYFLLFQLLASQNVTLLPSASGGPTLWPMNGTRSRQNARSTPLFRSWLCSSFLKYISHQHIHLLTYFAKSLFLIVDMSPCIVQVLGFSNLALRDPWPTLNRSSQAYTPSYSLMLRYGLAATLWLCIGLLQVKLSPFTLIFAFPLFPWISHLFLSC